MRKFLVLLVLVLSLCFAFACGKEDEKQDDKEIEQENQNLNLTEKEHIEYYLNQGLDKKEALKRVAKERGVSKSSLYKYTI